MWSFDIISYEIGAIFGLIGGIYLGYKIAKYKLKFHGLKKKSKLKVIGYERRRNS